MSNSNILNANVGGNTNALPPLNKAMSSGNFTAPSITSVVTNGDENLSKGEHRDPLDATVLRRLGQATEGSERESAADQGVPAVQVQHLAR